MTKKLKWGVMSTAKIGLQKVIPAMQQGKLCDVQAIASRNMTSAHEAAKKLGIPKAYDSYEALLDDPSIEAIYIPLPNHLHVPMAIKALKADKHVLCEKPVGMNQQEARNLMAEAEKHPHLKVMEAFMYRFHPQFIQIHYILKSGAIGEIKSMHSTFFYFNNNPEDIRNQADIGGGGLLDIGCYCISGSRYIMGGKPVRVSGALELDPKLKIDRLASGILDFGGKTATFTCSTQMKFQATMEVYGSKGKLVIDNPFVPPANQSTGFHVINENGEEHFEVAAANQYALMADAFAESVLNNKPVPTPLDDALENMQVIDGIFKSAQDGEWIDL